MECKQVLLAARTMELTEKELAVYEALANNPDIVVSGLYNDNE